MTDRLLGVFNKIEVLLGVLSSTEAEEEACRVLLFLQYLTWTESSLQ